MTRLVRLNEVQYVTSEYQVQKLVDDGFTVDKAYSEEQLAANATARSKKSKSGAEADAKVEPKGE